MQPWNRSSGLYFLLLKKCCASEKRRVSSAAFALVAFFPIQEFPMKPNFVNAILLALWPTRHGADARTCTKQDGRLMGERNRYSHS